MAAPLACATPANLRRRCSGRNQVNEDEIAEAAALWESLSQNHPFVDGNKRTAFASAYTFLAINGIEVAAEAEAVWTFLSDLYENGAFAFEALDLWLRRNSGPC